MSQPPRLVLMPGNNALIDARVMKNARTAAALGYDVVALGISRGETVQDELLPGGVRVVIQPISVRYESWRRRWRLFFDRSDRSTARAYAAYLAREARLGTARTARDARRSPLVQHPRRHTSLGRGVKQARAFWVRAWVKARSLRADSEIRRDSWDPVRLEAWRRRRFAYLRLTPWRARWRKALPQAVAQFMEIAQQLDALAPDLVHVHDVYMMPAAVQYAARAAKPVRLVYDAREFVPGLAHVDPLRVEAYSRMEQEFLQDFDRVVTVSDSLADLLQDRHCLVRRPALVLNAPPVTSAASEALASPGSPVNNPVPSVREQAGLGPEVPLLLYAGVVNPARGVGTVVQALPLLDAVHLALVVNNRGNAVQHLEAEAKRLGVADRLHLVPYVPYDQVTTYFA
ncbi:MAG: glycosyltransferase, partial [Bifidobacteriaceae bacterium]|nr:glycosyltransferase [Bifidobacteriaceae bacterium]